MMTLRELMDRVDDVSDVKRVPSVFMLKNSGIRIVASEGMEQETKVTAFENGFVLYQSGLHSTVFPIHTCREYCEKDVMENEYIVPFEVFAEQPWQIRAFMEGEKRVVHNMRALREYHREISYDAYRNGENLLSDNGEGDPIRILTDEEVSREEIRQLYNMLDTLTQKQKEILYRCVLDGRTQVDVADELGTSRSNVSDTLKKTLKKIRKGFGIAEQKFPRNRFCRPQEE